MAAIEHVHARSNRLVLVAAALVTAMVALPADAVRSYTAVSIGSLGGTVTHALAINANGEVTGYSSTGSGTIYHAFHYHAGTMTDLGTFGGTFSSGQAINVHGQIAGYANLPGDAVSHAFLYSGGTMTDLGTLGGSSSVASGINSAGVVVGYASVPSGADHAFIEWGGVMADLGTLPGGFRSYATAINSSGQITGYADTLGSAYSHAFLYASNTMTDLGAFGGLFSFGNAINDAGRVTGRYFFLGTDSSAFVYDAGVVITLPKGDFVGANATAINNRGEIVGSVAGFPLTAKSDALLFLGGAVYGLTPLVISGLNGVQLTSATGINDSGQIIANGCSGSTSPVCYAFLLTPVPVVVPAFTNPALIVVASMLLLVGMIQLRRTRTTRG